LNFFFFKFKKSSQIFKKKNLPPWVLLGITELSWQQSTDLLKKKIFLFAPFREKKS